MTGFAGGPRARATGAATPAAVVGPAGRSAASGPPDPARWSVLTGRHGRWSASSRSMWLGAATLLVGVLAWMVAHPLITVTRCVSADRPLAWLGVHLALLREHPDCTAGQYALDARPGPVAGLVVMVAAPTLLMNLCTVLGVVGVWVTLRTLLTSAAEAVRRLWPRPPAQPRLARCVCRAAPLLRAARRSLRAWQLDRSPVLRRGPPILLA